jgi:peroxiredoxin Q/BCP
VGKKVSKKKTSGKPAASKKAAKKKTVARKAAKKPAVAEKAAKKKTVARPAPAGKTAGRKATGAARKATRLVSPPDHRPSAGVPAPPSPPLELATPSVRPDVGDAAPAFDLSDEGGRRVSSADLAGEPYVLYFYPRDNTPGCTVEACGFRDAMPAFEALGVRVLGVSPDSVASHVRFRDKYDLSFTLLADTDRQLANAYGTWVLKSNYGREFMGIERSTFLVGPDGVIRAVWRRVRVAGHVDEVQSAAAALDN